jgi:hypothetical protein
LRTPHHDTWQRARHLAFTEGDDSRLHRRNIAICFLQQTPATSGQVERQSWFAQLQPIQINNVDIRQIARLKFAAII